MVQVVLTLINLRGDSSTFPMIHFHVHAQAKVLSINLWRGTSFMGVFILPSSTFCMSFAQYLPRVGKVGPHGNEVEQFPNRTRSALEQHRQEHTLYEPLYTMALPIISGATTVFLGLLFDDVWGRRAEICMSWKRPLWSSNDSMLLCT